MATWQLSTSAEAWKPFNHIARPPEILIILQACLPLYRISLLHCEDSLCFLLDRSSIIWWQVIWKLPVVVSSLYTLHLTPEYHESLFIVSWNMNTSQTELTYSCCHSLVYQKVVFGGFFIKVIFNSYVVQDSSSNSCLARLRTMKAAAKGRNP